MPRVAGQGLQGQRSGAKENAVDGALIPQGKWTELVRQRKDSVKVGDGQQLGGASLQPLGLVRSLALGAMAVATGLVADFLVIALRALPQVTAQSGGCDRTPCPATLSAAVARRDSGSGNLSCSCV